MSFLTNQVTFGSSLLGSKAEAMEMLALAAEKGVKPWVQELPMSRKSPRRCRLIFKGAAH
jgi:alcohol dehydrogenase (NADP+)